MRRSFLGIDVGTSSAKGVLVGAGGRVLRSATREHEVSRPRPGWAEMDAGVWWDEFVSITRELTGGAPAPEAVGVSGMGPCVLPADARDRPLRPAILYGVDTRAAAQIASLTARLGGDEAIERRTGARLSTQAVGPKLVWLAENEPGVFAATRRLYMPSSWLVRNLTGRYVLDHHSASQCWPMYDPAARGWHLPWTSQIAPDLELPALLWPGDVAGHVTQDASAETGIRAGTPVVAGTIDAWSEAVSVGAQSPGDLMLMYGTTMFLIDTVAEPITAPSLWGTLGAYPGTHCLAGGMATSGAVTAWLRGLFGSPDYAQLLELAEASGAGAGGVLMLPYFAGERTPIADPSARGALVGLTLTSTRGDLYRAALEATAFGVRHNLEAIAAAGGETHRIVAVGGGTQGRLWTQIVSDATGRAQLIPTQRIGASFGAAYLAASAVGTADIREWNPIQETVEPDPATHESYEERYRLYRDLYPATREIMHALAATQEEQR